jgi:serine/threonine-protein kinase
MDQFGKYQLFKRIAVGGMAEIFLAKLLGVKGFEKLVVVKRILPNLVGQPEFVAMFLDEARLAASLNHPNIVQVYDLGETNGSYFIAMEFVAGHDLLSVMRRGLSERAPLPFALAARIVAGACEGLHYAHTKKDLRGNPLRIVHRDISPGNLLISYDGTVKVTDFGVAKAETQSTKTEAGQVKGKFAYMSPEQVRGDPVDARSDVFSLGVVLHETLTGRRLFKKENELAIIGDILMGEVKAPSELRPEVPRALDVICLKALSKDLRKRHQSARELALDLEKYLATLADSPTAVQLGEFMTRTFAADFEVYQRALSELPVARPEDLATLFKDPTNSSKAPTSQPSFSSPDPDATSAIRMPKRRPWLKALAAVALLCVVGAGVAVALRSPPPPAAVSGGLVVESEPSGASISLDGKPTGELTPHTFQGLTLDANHTVRLEVPGREAKETTVRLDAAMATRALSLVLPLAPGALEVVTTPPGATVYVDGRAQKGVSPLVLGGLSSEKEYAVRAVKDGFAEANATARVSAGKQERVELTLAAPAAAVPGGPKRRGPVKEQGQVTVTTEPATDVFFEGKALGRTPVTAKLPVGHVALTFINRELDLTQTSQVDVERGQGRVALTFRKGKVAADVTPWADIYLGEKKLGTTPLAPRELYEGTYTLRLVNSELGAIKTLKVVVNPQKTTVIHETLN